MPPRFAYWTILIDNKPTAFRARMREELLPTLQQLRRKNTDVVMKWFSGGRLWLSPEEASAVRAAEKRGAERRPADWRAGGAHKDPRDRFRKKRHDRPPAAQGQRAAGPRPPSKRFGDRRPQSKPFGDRRPPSKRFDERQSERPPSQKPWRPKPAGDRERRPNQWRDKPGGHRPPPVASGSREPRRDARRPPREDRAPSRPPDARPKRNDDSVQPPPPSEQITRKPEPPERG